MNLYGVDEMRQSSVIIHKGRREEKYEIYIEDYVMSYLKEETGTLKLSELYFYGIRENGGRRYVIYGAGKDKKLASFDKYSLLDEIGCRLTQAGPVFLVKEENGIYEIKGYEVFYQDNREMQNYLIEHSAGRDQKHRTNTRSKGMAEDNTRKVTQNRTPHGAISVQLGIILVALVAIVINSTNSYDKMNQLNQSALEVFFAIENQEADREAAPGDSEQEEDTLNLAMLENAEQAQETVGDEMMQTEADEGVTEEVVTDDIAVEDTAATGDTDTDTGETTADEEEHQDDAPDEGSVEEEELEALSRNVARYYEVEKGDTLYTICKKIYGDITYVQKICEINQITNPDNIRYGQKIVLP